MDRNFRPIKQKYPENFAHYMDDMVIGTGDSPDELEKHRKIVCEVLDLFRKHSYFLKLKKCVFETQEITFLGYKIGHGVAKVESTKMDGLRNWPRTLTCVKDVQQVIGVLGYQRPFIQGFAELAKPLTYLTKKGVPFNWTPECHDALDKLIAKVTDDPELVAPDPTQQFELETDASNFALGAILFQKDDRGKRHAIGYASKTLNAAERNYDIWDKELLGLIFGLTKW